MPRSRNTADILLSSTTAELGYISGLTLSRSSATVLAIAAGLARNEDGGVPYTMQSAAFTKTIGSAWAAGTGNGSLDTGAIANNTWYHVHQIRKDSDGSIDFVTSLSATAPTMPSGYVARRRIGAFKTNGSAQITNFRQIGNVFKLDVPVIDVNATNPGTAAATRALPSVPSGVSVFPIVAWNLLNITTAAIQFLVSDLAGTDNTPTSSLCHINTAVANARGFVTLSDIPTDTSAQLRTRQSASGASDQIVGITHGWIDLRGQG